MQVRHEILSFLRTPGAFARGAKDPEVWINGLEGFAIPSIATNGDWALRPAQQAAWRGLAEQRVGLILGPPGTGKTHLLSWLITGYSRARRDAGLPCRVFVTAFTRNAIGNVLDAVAERARTHAPDLPAPIYMGAEPPGGLSDLVQRVGRDTGQPLEAINCGTVVLGGTVWSLHRMLNSEAIKGAEGPTAPLFDLICIDEASQMVLAHGLMTLAGLAPDGRVIVAGDDQQLPPVRSSRETKLDGRELGGSLYTFLKSTNVAEFPLDETFRLSAPLTQYPEQKFYPGRYTSVVPNQRLNLRDNWESGLPPWQQIALHPEFPVVVFVHDGPTAATSNPFEAVLTAELAKSLHDRVVRHDGTSFDEGSFWTDAAAIVSPHRAQNAAIRSALGDVDRDNAFVETVDRIQGKERDAILLSYCVADPEFALAEGEFIFSPERLNVAITRARKKLVMFVSRHLLEAAPNDQEVMDKAELLREFVFSCEPEADLLIDGPRGRTIPVQVRVRGFGGAGPVLNLVDNRQPAVTKHIVLTPEHERVLQAARTLALTTRSPTLARIKRELARSTEPYEECRDLHGAGWVLLELRDGQYGAYWTVRPFHEPRRIFAADYGTVRTRIGQVIREARQGTLAPFYNIVRDAFFWMTADRADCLLPVLKQLQDEGLVKLNTTANGALTVDVPRPAVEALPDEVLPELPSLSDSDFEVLNALEAQEAKRINFAIFDSWTSSVALARSLRRPVGEITAAVGRLHDHGHLIMADDGRLRSRMAELARELRYVKQRFKLGDADKRPYLIRSLKIELRDRDKPVRDVSLRDAVQAATPTDAYDAMASEGLLRALGHLWGHEAYVAGFQARGFKAILEGWRGGSPDAVVVAADTGSGKTEAAVLPMIAAAAADRLRGVEGVRAILTYPRIRLVANQAQRLAKYLSALAQVGDLPTVTLGMQVGSVPRSFQSLASWDHDAGWQQVGPDKLTFPFFGCPHCGSPVHLVPDGGIDGADALVCTAEDWRFDGWIGSKDGLKRTPPAFFLPTVDSLHQWLHDKQYGALFGDDPRFAPPRALLADEIHLYTHIHGAQVGYALQRLATRAQLNMGGNRAMLAVGMSATLGDPSLAWGRLIGRNTVLKIAPTADELEVNPRGREYFYFVQPEVESRGHDIAGASTTIQALMCLGHGMRRRTGSGGGFRSLVFLDSIDKLRRLHSAYCDAEEGLELAALRTRDYGDDAAGVPQETCCGEPAGCDHFRQGECWWFAANDPRQRAAAGRLPVGAPLKVAPKPIFSGTGGGVEKLIKDADIIFATSSLEVGYDDPDITLVYQHYAPQNLASFIQRKGRGGRGIDDRPITAVTLSIYSPRDSWWFRRPHEMISPAGFETPLNPSNFFVRRGQAVCAILDVFARRAVHSEQVFDAGGRPVKEALAQAEAYVRELMGAEIWTELGVANVHEFWGQATAGLTRETELPKLRDQLPWAPGALFDTINLPSAHVLFDQDQANQPAAQKEDISLVLPTIAPGNATRRFHGVSVHWRPPVQGRALWLAETDYNVADWAELYPSSDDLLTELPRETWGVLSNLEPALCRPRQISLERLGRTFGAGWTPEWVCSADPATVRKADAGKDGSGVKHDVRGALRGFLIIKSDAQSATKLDISSVNAWVSQAAGFIASSSGTGETGLTAAQVYWGADAEVKIERLNSEPVAFAQTFVHPSSKRPLLHGYKVETEGLQIQLDSKRLDEFVEGELRRLETIEADRRWHSAQFMRFLVESRAQNLGVNSYEARRGADLIVAAAGDPDLRKRLLHLLQYWDAKRLGEILEDARAKLLSQHPLMSPRRVARTAESLASDAFRDLTKTALAEVKRPDALATYLRSAVLHSLMLRLKQSFVQVGRGDDRRVLGHVKLPIQFGGTTDDVITLCEAGAHGDGTTRAVLANFEEALGHWRDGFISDCPNAEEDEVLRHFWSAREQHKTWREADPRDLQAMSDIARAVGVSGSEPVLPAAVLRVLYGAETVGPDRIELYELAADVETVRLSLEERLGRKAQDWELTSAAVEQAKGDRQRSSLGRLFDVYTRQDDVSEDSSLSAEARLADQVYRIGARLCTDGCRGCLHQDSQLMSSSLVEVSVSRILLQRFLCS